MLKATPDKEINFEGEIEMTQPEDLSGHFRFEIGELYHIIVYIIRFETYLRTLK